MYKKFYGLRDKPFNLTPDPEYLYLGSHHREALEFLSSGLRNNLGVMVLTGGVGSGKTLVLRSFVKSLGPEVSVIQVFYPSSVCIQLLQMILLNLGIQSIQGDLNALRSALKDHLTILAGTKKSPLLVIDEAQNLGEDALREVISLTGPDEGNRGGLNVVLVGLPKLRDKLALLGPDMFRNNALHHLTALPEEEVPKYISYRLSTAGCSDVSLFPGEILSGIVRYSGGVPRVVNIICDALLAHGYFSNNRTITPSALKEVIADLSDGLFPGLNDVSGSIPGDDNNGLDVNVCAPHGGQKYNMSSGGPDIAAETQDLVRTTPEQTPESSVSLKVFIMENNPRMRVHLEHLFQKFGYDFVLINEFDHLFEALSRSSCWDIQIIVSDSACFFSSGGEEDPMGKSALDRLQAEFAHAPVIVTSVLPLTAIRNKLLKRGISFFVPKPDLNTVDMSGITSRVDAFFEELRCCLASVHTQFNAFYQRIKTAGARHIDEEKPRLRQ